MRIHRVTHPVLGPASWKEIREAAQKIKDETGKRVCSWCHKEVPQGMRTRCGSRNCAEMIWRSYSWPRCKQMAQRRDKDTCRLCRRYGDEVDHIIPVSLGGTGDLDNLRTLCNRCHKEETKRLRREKEEFLAQGVPKPPPIGVVFA